MKNILLIFSMVLVVQYISGSHCYAFRCGNEIVGRWDTKAEVLKRCGHPFKESVTYETINGTFKMVDNWFYNCGEDDFIYVLKFVDNIVVKDDTIQRGAGLSQCKEPKK